MKATEEDFGRWKHVLFAAELLQKTSPQEKKHELEILLQSLSEHFPRATDPVTDFPGYAFRRFCLALYESLESK